MPRFVLLAGACLLASRAPAFAACEFIAADNKRLDNKLASLETQLQQLDTELAAMETACQKEQQQIAGTGGASATGDSCIALGENEALNRKLNSSSASCAARHMAMRKTIDLFRSSAMEPFRDAMQEIRKMHAMVESYLPNCRREFQESREIGNRSQGALLRAQASVAKAQDDIKNFNRVGAESGRLAKSSGEARVRCVSEQAGGEAPLALARDAGGKVLAVPAGRSQPGQSNVTGVADKIHFKPISSRVMLTGNPIGRSASGRSAGGQGAGAGPGGWKAGTGASRGESEVSAPGAAGRAPAALGGGSAGADSSPGAYEPGVVDVAWTDSGSAAMQVQSLLKQASAGIAGADGEAIGPATGSGAVLVAVMGEAGRKEENGAHQGTGMGEQSPTGAALGTGSGSSAAPLPGAAASAEVGLGEAPEGAPSVAASAGESGPGAMVSQAGSAGLTGVEISLFERVHRVLRMRQARL